MTDNRFTFTIDNGYPDEVREVLESAVRDVDCQPDAMILTDRFVFSGEAISITEQFVSLKPILGENGRLTCGDTVLTYDPDLFDMEISSEDFRRNSGNTDTLHFVRLHLKNVERDNTLVFRFE